MIGATQQDLRTQRAPQLEKNLSVPRDGLGAASAHPTLKGRCHAAQLQSARLAGVVVLLDRVLAALKDDHDAGVPESPREPPRDLLSVLAYEQQTMANLLDAAEQRLATLSMLLLEEDL